MTDCLNVPYAERHVDPDEPGLVAGYTFGEGELAQFGRYLNRARTGAAYDLTTRNNTPIVGQGGGIRAITSNDWWTRTSIDVGSSNFAYEGIFSDDGLAAAFTEMVQNWRHYALTPRAPANPSISFDSGGTSSVATYNVQGRGPVHFAALYDGTDQVLVLNGREAARTAVVPHNPAGGALNVGRNGTCYAFKMYNIRRTVAQARASYVREFARRVVYQWTPRDVGEGPAGGIVTGATGDTWNCILGDATLKFVWMTEPRLRQKQLALTGVNNQSPCRLEFPHTRMPSFGTWRWGTVARSLAATPEVYLAQLPRQTHAAAGSGCYWGRIAVTGGYWTITWYRENGAAMLTRINTSAAAALGDIVETAVSRAVDGTWRADVGVNGNWANQGVNAANDVTYLSSNFVGVQPNSGHVLGLVRYQSEMVPGEFPRSDWYAPSLWSLVW